MKASDPAGGGGERTPVPPGATVGAVATLAGVSVRTLHHYDAIGLLRPSERSGNGYRRYGTDDLERLQRILAYRELGFELAAIQALLDDPDVDRLEHLRRQAALIDTRIERLQAMRTTLRKTMEAHSMGIDLDPSDLLEVFGDADPSEHAAEAEERWGGSEAYRHSQARTRSYTKAEWLSIRREAEGIEAEFATALGDGVPADGERALEAAEAHRRHIDRWFYPCDPAMHLALAEMYEADPRFKAHYDERAPGLAHYVAQAIRAAAGRT